MSSVFSIVNEGRNAMFRVNQSRKPWDETAGPASLAEKLENETSPWALDPKFLDGARAAASAMEEARRIGGPKATGEQRLEKAERRIRELRQEARMAAARGDRDKLAQLAREAAMVAREAGRAAHEFGMGVAAAAIMGKGGGEESTTTIRSSTVTLTLQQTETVVDLRISSDASAAMNAGAAMTAGAAAPETLPAPATLPAEAVLPAEDAGMDELVDQAMAIMGAIERQDGASPPSASPPSASPSTADLIGAHDARMSRWKEADEFGRRVEAVLGHVKAVLGEAKRANETDPDHDRRKARRKELDEYDKDIAAAREATGDLRSAAFGTGPLADAAAAAMAWTGGVPAVPTAAAATSVIGPVTPAVDVVL